jgi:hypothetical protein
MVDRLSSISLTCRLSSPHDFLALEQLIQYCNDGGLNLAITGQLHPRITITGPTEDLQELFDHLYGVTMDAMGAAHG